MELAPTSQQLNHAKTLWSLTGEPTLHRKVENFIYVTHSEDKKLILRLTEPRRRSKQQLESELDWQNWLIEHGAHCSKPIYSNDRNLVEALNDGEETYFASVFEFAPGSPLRKCEDFTVDAVRSWGAAVGELHNLTASYSPSSAVAQRPQWSHEMDTGIKQQLLACQSATVRLAFQEKLDWLLDKPTNPDSYGLVHTDMHTGNFFWDGSRITIFDFDDCCYHWLMYDLAVPVFYLRLNYRNQNLNLQEITDFYLEGYQSKRALPADWKPELENFVSYRMLYMYGWSLMQLERKGLDEGGLQWCRDFLKVCEDQLKNSKGLGVLL